jgi:WD40 repeat protein
MKNLILTLLITLLVCTTLEANDPDALWYRQTGDIEELDFTPDDKHVIIWTTHIEFWEVEQGVKEFSILSDAIGDFNYNEEFIVFSENTTPKLLNWQTKEVVGGFEKEERPLGRIRTAKSKNEFIAQSIDSKRIGSFGDDNIVYFWDIDTKQKVDSIVSLNVFDKDHYRWGRMTMDYDYIGESDELVYIKYADDNSYEIPIEPMYHRTNYFYHIYNIQTKEMIDSIFIYQLSKNDFEYEDKMKVMNDRTKIAWNKSGGNINFYDLENNELSRFDQFSIDNKKPYDDIEFTNNDKFMCLAIGNEMKLIDMETKAEIARFTYGSYSDCITSHNNTLMAGSIVNSLLLYPIITTGIEGENNQSQATFSPNPTSNFVSIDLNCSGAMVDYQINDVNGATVAQSTIAIQSENLQLNFSGYATGVYFLTINCNAPKTYKIIKE